MIYTADIQDRDGAPLVLEEIVKISLVAASYLRRWWHSLSRAPALAGSRRAGNKVNDALGRTAQWTIEIISRSDPTRVFEAALTLAWLHRSRRLAKNSSRPSHRLPHGSLSRPSNSLPAASQSYENTPDDIESDFETSRTFSLPYRLARYLARSNHRSSLQFRSSHCQIAQPPCAWPRSFR